MTMTMTKKEQYEKFNELVSVNANSLASQKVTFTEEGEFSYTEGDVYGDTATVDVRISLPELESELEYNDIEKTEMDVMVNLFNLFVSVNFNQAKIEEGIERFKIFSNE